MWIGKGSSRGLDAGCSPSHHPRRRRANGGREDPHSYCMPPNFPRAWTLPQRTRIVQTPGMMVVLHEFNGAYREVYLDGRPLPVNPNPTWNGYSTG